MRTKTGASGLTDLESLALSLIWRMQPLTAYQLRQAFAVSPARNIALSQGSIYPLIERLKRKGLVATAPIEGDGRGTEHIRSTPAGEDAIRDWVRDPVTLLPEDPLRSKLLALKLLPREERTAWARSMKASLLESLAAFEEFAQDNPGELLELAHDNARSTLLARIRWIERVETRLDQID